MSIQLILIEIQIHMFSFVTFLLSQRMFPFPLLSKFHISNPKYSMFLATLAGCSSSHMEISSMIYGGNEVEIVIIWNYLLCWQLFLAVSTELDHCVCCAGNCFLWFQLSWIWQLFLVVSTELDHCVCVCVRACACACVCVYVCACVRACKFAHAIV